MQNQLYRNLGNGRFEDVSARAGAVFQRAEVSRGGAFGDIDNDGDVDVLVGTAAGPTRLLINNVGNRNTWVGLRLLGAGDEARHARRAGAGSPRRRRAAAAPGPVGRQLRVGQRPARARRARGRRRRRRSGCAWSGRTARTEEWPSVADRPLDDADAGARQVTEHGERGGS